MHHPAVTYSPSELLAGAMACVENGSAYRVHDKATGLSLFCYTKSGRNETHNSEFLGFCRGLVLDPLGIIVALPFPRFFNYGEKGGLALPDEPFEATDKIDGSLGIVFHYAGTWRVATKGHFFSHQATWGARHILGLATAALDHEVTYLCEMVIPGNRIIVDYGDKSEFVLLAGYNRNSGEEISRCNLLATAAAVGSAAVKNRSFRGIADMVSLCKTLPYSEEGFVVRFQSGMRIKIKGHEYCRIHRIVSRITPLGVWESYLAGDDISAIAASLPNELASDLNAIRVLLASQHGACIAELAKLSLATNHLSDAELAEALPNLKGETKQFIFSLRNGKFASNIANRRRLFNLFRPTADRLDGYVPTSAINRIHSES